MRFLNNNIIKRCTVLWCSTSAGITDTFACMHITFGVVIHAHIWHITKQQVLIAIHVYMQVRHNDHEKSNTYVKKFIA